MTSNVKGTNISNNYLSTFITGEPGITPKQAMASIDNVVAKVSENKQKYEDKKKMGLIMPEAWKYQP